MEFSIAREQLFKALRAVSGVVERKLSSNQILSNALFVVEQGLLSITASDQNLELSCSVPILDPDVSGKALIPFKKIMDICGAIPEDLNVLFKISVEKIIVTAGKSRFTISCLLAETFPSFSLSEQTFALNLDRKVFLDLIHKTAFAMAEQDVRYFLNGLFFSIQGNKVQAVAADGHRLIVNTILLPENLDCNLGIIIPRKSVLEIIRVLSLNDTNELLNLSMGNNQFRMHCGNLELVSRLLDGKFPDYRAVMPRGGDKIIVVDRNLLKETLWRTSILLNDKVKGVLLLFKPGVLQIFANNSEKDESEDEILIDYDGQELEIGFNVRYLIDFLTISSAHKVRFTCSAPSNSVLIEGVVAEQSVECSSIYIIMPMRA